MSSAENEKIAAEPSAHQKLPVLDHSQYDKEDTQECEKKPVAHGFHVRATFLRCMLEDFCWPITQSAIASNSQLSLRFHGLKPLR